WRRLPRTAAPVDDYELLAGCLAGMVCRLPNEDAAPLPLEIFAEDAERLYGASWFEREGLLVLFEQTFDGRRALPNGEYHGIFDEKEAVAKAKQLLEEAASPKNYDLSQLNEMPVRLYALPLNAPEVELSVLDGADDSNAPELDCEDEDDDFQIEREEKGLAAEIVLEYLRQFAGGKLRRLQLEWYDGNLVFVMDKSGYACFYFETFGRTKNTWYALISQPDIYQNVEHDEVKYYPFGMGKLAEYCLFHDTAPIMSKLDLILMSVSRGSPQTRAGGSWLWSTTTNLQDAEHRLILAKIKLAGYPPQRCRNYPLKKFVISKYPAEVESVDNAGEKTVMTVKSGSYGHASAALIQFMQKKLTRLRLTWTAKEGTAGHLVLLRDDNCYMMIWLQDRKRCAVFCTADGTGESLFNRHAVPAHLVHHDLKQIRSCLDLMLDDMTDPSPVTDRLFAPGPEGWPYEEIFRELVGTN
ncbi:MAG: hypothetical protein K2O18_18420, partial [Oscillospiraceae bacterium]|nr:hypothetical protein [Oscillospiraceae bacterium]